MKKLTSLLALAVLSFSLAGCVVAYKTDDFRNSLNGSLASLDGSIGQVNADYAEKSGAFELALQDGGDKSKGIYKEMAATLSKMRDASVRLNAQRTQLANSKTKAEAAMAGKDRIRSDDPGYKQVQGVRDDWENGAKQIQKIFREYQAASTRFVEQSNKGGFRLVDTGQLRQQADKLGTDYAKTLTELDTKLETITKQVASQPPEKRQPNEATLARIRVVASEIKGQEKEIKSSVKELLDALPANRRYFVGPNSKSHEKLRRVEALLAKITAQANEITTLGNQLQR